MTGVSQLSIVSSAGRDAALGSESGSITAGAIVVAGIAITGAGTSVSGGVTAGAGATATGVATALGAAGASGTVITGGTPVVQPALPYLAISFKFVSLLSCANFEDCAFIPVYANNEGSVRCSKKQRVPVAMPERAVFAVILIGGVAVIPA